MLCPPKPPLYLPTPECSTPLQLITHSSTFPHPAPPPTLQLPLPQQPLPPQPRPDILPVPLQPAALGPHAIQALLELLLETRAVLPREEGLDSADVLRAREAGRGTRDDVAQQRDRGRALALDGLEVFLEPGPQHLNALGVVPQRHERQVEVLRLDLVAQRQSERARAECGAFRVAEPLQRSVLLVGVLGGAELVEEDFVFVLAAVLERDPVHAAADVGVDGLAVAGGEGFEHALGGGDDGGVAAEAGVAEEEGFELRLDVVFVVGEGPAFGVGFGGDEGALESLECFFGLGRLLACFRDVHLV